MKLLIPNVFFITLTILLTTIAPQLLNSHNNYYPSKSCLSTNVTSDEAMRAFENHIMDIYYSANLGHKNLDYNVFKYAITGFYNLKSQYLYHPNQQILSIIDYRQASTKKRLYVVDIQRKKLLYNTWVAHGINNGMLYATHFSNRPNSRQASLGFYRTGESYSGKFGYAMRLDGLERNFNHNARRRSIVMHSDPMIDAGYIAKLNMLSRSWGCPAVSADIHKPLINLIRNGSCLFIYYNDINYLNNSLYLNNYMAASFFYQRNRW